MAHTSHEDLLADKLLVIGVQHHILAQLFLAQFDPTIPRVGTKRGAAVKAIAVSLNLSSTVDRKWLIDEETCRFTNATNMWDWSV